MDRRSAAPDLGGDPNAAPIPAEPLESRVLLSGDGYDRLSLDAIGRHRGPPVSPATGWANESTSDRLGDAAPSIPGPVSYQTTRAGTQHIAGVSESGHLLHLFWMPDGAGWRARDLTETAIG